MPNLCTEFDTQCNQETLSKKLEHALQLAAKQLQLATKLFFGLLHVMALMHFAAQAFANTVAATLTDSSCHEAAACSASDLCQQCAPG